MIELRTSEAALAVNGRVSGRDTGFSGVTTDSRSTVPGQLFVALHGPNFDGHDWLGQAADAGAVAAMIDKPMDAEIPVITVEDTRRGLGALASFWRDQFDIPVIGITGSAGKTTVKEMVGAILAEQGNPLITRGNLNNDIGVPLTLFRLGKSTTAAVIEMGANKAGDISYLTRIAKPQFGVVTLCAPAHLEGFGDLETIARTKGELFEHLAESGTAVVNNEDTYAGLWKSLAGRRSIVTFGDGGDVRAEKISVGAAGSSFLLVTPEGSARCIIATSGRHNVNNALASAAIALAVGVGIDQIVAGLARARPAPGRLNFRAGIGGSRVIDDSYNANPASMRAALHVLAAQSGEKWLVMGDMGELGPTSSTLHAEVATQAVNAGVTRLYGLGQHTANTCAAFGAGAEHFQDIDDLSESVVSALERADVAPVVLIKASRAMALDKVVKNLESGSETQC